MANPVSAIRYAQAAFQIAIGQDALDQWMDDLSLMAQALDSPEFADFLEAPQVPIGKKVEVIKSTLGGSVDRLAVNLISLLASRGIARIIPSIVAEYQRLLDSHRGIERAQVVTAVPLDDARRQRIAELLQDIVGKEVRMTSRVNPEIIGGLIARVGDRVIDGSTRTRLQAMRRELIQGPS